MSLKIYISLGAFLYASRLPSQIVGGIYDHLFRHIFQFTFNQKRKDIHTRKNNASRRINHLLVNFSCSLYSDLEANYQTWFKRNNNNTIPHSPDFNLYSTGYLLKYLLPLRKIIEIKPFLTWTLWTQNGDLPFAVFDLKQTYESLLRVHRNERETKINLTRKAKEHLFLIQFGRKLEAVKIKLIQKQKVFANLSSPILSEMITYRKIKYKCLY